MVRQSDKCVMGTTHTARNGFNLLIGAKAALLAWVLVIVIISDRALVFGVEGRAGKKVLHFPTERVVGSLSMKQSGDLSMSAGSDWAGLDDEEQWQFFGLARGDVVVPANQNIFLTVNLKPGSDDLAWLGELEPSDLYGLKVGSWEQRGPANRISLEAIAHLSGLQRLMLSNTGITASQLAALKPLSSLKSLTLNHELAIRSDGIAALKEFPALEYLGCWGLPGDGDLKVIAQLPYLCRLKLRTDAMRGPGLAHLASAPHLEWLWLWGDSFKGQPLRYLEGLTNLKTLHVWNDCLSDASLASIGKLAALEELYVRKSPTNSHKFTDAGIAHLKNLKNLRSIELPGCTVSEVGVHHLASLPNLETIREVKYVGEGLNSLISCPHLKRLRVSIRAVDVPVLARFSGLGELDVVVKNACDEDMVSLESVTGITDLTLFEARDISERGWASMGKFSRLKTLKIYGQVAQSSATNRGLNHLSNLTNLETLELRMSSGPGALKDDARLDLGTLTNLRILRISGLNLQESDLEFLKSLVTLKELKLQNYGQVSGNVLDYVGGLPKLNRLEIIGITCTDGSGLARLCGLKNLEFLSLTGRITDDALAQMTGSQTLVTFDVTTDVRISPQTMTHLRDVLPRVRSVNVKQPQQARRVLQRPSPTTRTSTRAKR